MDLAARPPTSQREWEGAHTRSYLPSLPRYAPDAPLADLAPSPKVTFSPKLLLIGWIESSGFPEKISCVTVKKGLCHRHLCDAGYLRMMPVIVCSDAGYEAVMSLAPRCAPCRPKRVRKTSRFSDAQTSRDVQQRRVASDRLRPRRSSTAAHQTQVDLANTARTRHPKPRCAWTLARIR